MISPRVFTPRWTITLFLTFVHDISQGLHPMLGYYTEKYGNVWGFYEGTKATVSDVEMMKEIYIKEFSKFHSRKVNKVAP